MRIISDPWTGGASAFGGSWDPFRAVPKGRAICGSGRPERLRIMAAELAYAGMVLVGASAAVAAVFGDRVGGVDGDATAFVAAHATLAEVV